MKVFHCDHCRQLVFFENTQCMACGHLLAFVPHLMVVASLDPDGADGTEWTSPLPAAAGRRYRLCANYRDRQVCNWVVDAGDEQALCESCRLTRVIPDLSVEGYHAAWYRLEAAKRRLLYTLMKLGLSFDANGGEQPPLVFQFMSDRAADGAPAMTGHADGVVTINVAEAYDAERERRRHTLGEPYRTLLGHMRHEVGHYYWTHLVAGDPARLAGFRALFGDDSEDYGEALRRHYESGPPADWQARFVTAYASAHAWEDWAETWAHYLHMIDTLETVSTSGVVMRPRRPDEPSLERLSPDLVSADSSFDHLLDGWFPITYLLNNLNRGLGLADPYPFVLPRPAIEKLRFVHDSIAGAPAAPAKPPGS
jgi:hypothetical protein